MSVPEKRLRQRTILELVSRAPVGSQEELAVELRRRGFRVNQGIVAADIAELGLVKLQRGGRARYVSPEDLGNEALGTSDHMLTRVLSDTPITVARSGLTLVLRGPVGSAQTLARAIDTSTLQEQVGTLAGDDTVLVLFADEASLQRWSERFEALREGS